MTDTSATTPPVPPDKMPRWVWKAVAIFWFGSIIAILIRSLFDSLFNLILIMLVSIFLALAIEPGVNRLARRGWRRGAATGLILTGVLLAALVFVVAIGTLVGQQIADLLDNLDRYVIRTVDWINNTFDTDINPSEVIDSIKDENGPVQEFIESQREEVLSLSVAALAFMAQTLSVLLFTFYLVADGPKLRRSICSRMRPERQERVLATWDVAIDKTGGYIYSRALLALLSALSHWVLFQAIGVRAPVALALWVGLISQFVPVFGTYVAGALPVLITLIDSPVKAIVIASFVIIYQQVENYILLPRITARTMNLHPAIAFGSAIAGAAVLGAVGAVLAIPAAAMAQALLSTAGERHDVIDSHLTEVPPPKQRRRRGPPASRADAG